MKKEHINLALQLLNLGIKLGHEASKTSYTVTELTVDQMIAVMFAQINRPQVASLQSDLPTERLGQRLATIFAAYGSEHQMTSTTSDGWVYISHHRKQQWYEFIAKQEFFNHTLRILYNASIYGGSQIVIGCAFDEIGQSNLANRSAWAAAKKVRDLACLLSPVAPLQPLDPSQYQLPKVPQKVKK